MAIPYSAIVCCYETEFGFTLVHGYGRAYSPHEVEEGRTLTEGTEGCWTIRDSNTVKSFCVVHNGYLPKEEQTVTLTVVNSFGDSLVSQIQWPKLNAFETKIVYPSEHFKNLLEFLGGAPGQATFDFSLGCGFTRMLVGNQNIDSSDLQLTHSNFDYSRQKTDLTEPGMDGYMVVPVAKNFVRKVIVYPQMTTGSYQAFVNSEKVQEFESGQTVEIKNVKANTLTFKRKDGLFPVRLVTALELQDRPERVPGECSLGVITKLQPKKRFWWGVVTPANIAHCYLVVHDLPQVFNGMPKDNMVTLSLYASKKHQVLERKMTIEDLRQWDDGMSIHQIWPEASVHLDQDYGYYTLFSEYGGLAVYSLMKNEHGSVCLEHGF